MLRVKAALIANSNFKTVHVRHDTSQYHPPPRADSGCTHAHNSRVNTDAPPPLPKTVNIHTEHTRTQTKTYASPANELMVGAMVPLNELLDKDKPLSNN